MIIIRYKIKKSIIQMQITDYISGIMKEIYDMSIPKMYQRARKRFAQWLNIRPRCKKVKITNIPKCKRLDDYLPERTGIILPKVSYLLRFRAPPAVSYEDFAKGVIPKIEWDMLLFIRRFEGFFNHIFEVNDLGYFDDLQERLEGEGVDFKNIFIYDIIVYELIRRQIGFSDYTGLEKAFSLFMFNPLFPFLHNPSYFPAADEVSWVLNRIPSEYLMEYFLMLVREAIELRPIFPRILLADGQFIRSNSNNN